MPGERIGHDQRGQDRHHEHRGGNEDADMFAARDRGRQQRADQRHEQLRLELAKKNRISGPISSTSLRMGLSFFVAGFVGIGRM